MAKFTKRCRTLAPQTGPCKIKVFSPAEREFDTARSMGLVE